MAFLFFNIMPACYVIICKGLWFLDPELNNYLAITIWEIWGVTLLPRAPMATCLSF